MPEIERLGESIALIDSSFVERDWTPEWAIHECVQKADLQPVSIVTADRLAVDVKMPC